MGFDVLEYEFVHRKFDFDWKLAEHSDFLPTVKGGFCVELLRAYYYLKK